MTAEKLMEAIHKVEIPRPCRMYPDEMIAIAQANDGELFCAANDVFRYGFLRGQQAAKAEAKRKEKDRCRREAGKSAPGYGLLAAMAEKNKRNVRFVSVVSRFMLKMDGCADKAVKSND